jgi:hypothetical protein
LTKTATFNVRLPLNGLASTNGPQRRVLLSLDRSLGRIVDPYIGVIREECTEFHVRGHLREAGPAWCLDTGAAI